MDNSIKEDNESVDIRTEMNLLDSWNSIDVGNDDRKDDESNKDYEN